MESQIRTIILPLAEKLIKQLSEQLSEPHSKQLGLFGIELLVGKLLSAMAVDLIAALIALLFNGGYEGATIKCSGGGGKMTFHTCLAPHAHQQFRSPPI